MSVIKVDNLSFSYPASDEIIFDNVSFQIDSDWKIGFVGRNGRGKTTFLKLLTGKYEYGGKISASVQFDYFPYAVADKSELTYNIVSGVCPHAEDWEILREFSLLDMNAETLYRAFDTLSGGEQAKALLAALFLNENTFLLIDEPTNHLDAKARDAVAKYLKRKKSFILVSHDRSFLDGCVDHILSLNRSDIEVQSGNFSSFLTNYNRNQEFERRENERLQGDIRRLQDAASQTADWADRVEASKIGAGDKGYVGHMSAKMMKRSKCIKARRQRAVEEKERLFVNTENQSPLKISPLTYRAQRLAVLSSLSPVYDGREICTPLSFEIMRGERIALDGGNGCGKSSVLKILCGENISYNGAIYKSNDLIISYVPQDTSKLCGKLSEFAAAHEIDESLFKAILHKTGFDKDEFDKDISRFSEGQKKKVLIAKSLCERAHLYVWDEPLNYIDVFSRMQLENLLLEYQPTMVFVEHDKAFKEKVATKIIEIK